MGGYSIDLILDQDQGLHKEFICTICHDVLKNPIMSYSCEHIYCTTCIRSWVATSKTCPIDRHPIKMLRPPFRAFMNLYNDIKLCCGFDGCSTESTLGQIEEHWKSCEHNPEAIKPCAAGCGASIKMKEIPSHNCMEYLKGEIRKKDAAVSNLKEELKVKEEKRRVELNEKCSRILKLQEKLTLMKLENYELKKQAKERKRGLDLEEEPSTSNKDKRVKTTDTFKSIRDKVWLSDSNLIEALSLHQTTSGGAMCLPSQHQQQQQPRSTTATIRAPRRSN